MAILWPSSGQRLPEVERAQPRLDMAERDAAIARGAGAGDGAGRVALDEHEIDPLPPEFAAQQRSAAPPQALALRSAPRIEAELADSAPGKIEIAVQAVMLAGQDQTWWSMPRRRRQRPCHRRHLDRLGPGPDDRDDAMAVGRPAPPGSGCAEA